MADRKTRRHYVTSGEGVQFPYGEPTVKEKARIEMLGVLNDKRTKYVGCKSPMGLYKVAAEYRRLGMLNTAAAVWAEAKGL
ncbi:MAG TPA: hypothetical protein VIY48_06950 [Candidatus Paceibacterota bacterium]